MAAVCNLQLTVKVNDSTAPLLLKALLLPLHLFAWIERIRCKLLSRTPMQVNIDVTVGHDEERPRKQDE